MNDKWDMGTTPIIHFAKNGNLAIMEILISHGADINHQDNNGETKGHAGTALMLAHEHLKDAVPLLPYFESKALKKLSKSA